MLRKPLLSLLLALVLAAIFIGGLAHLFALRYEVGDIYPAYSSLRADPLGTKALATALGELPGIEVHTNFRSLPKLQPKKPVTLVYAGVSHHAVWTSAELRAFDSLVLTGSRAIFTFYPIESPPSPKDDKNADDEELRKKESQAGIHRKARSDADKKSSKADKSGAHDEEKSKSDKKDDKKKSTENEEETSEEKFIDFPTVAKRWGFKFGYLPEEKGKAYSRHAALVEPGGHLESDISWHTALDFQDLKPQWKVLYMCGTMPVVIERQYGNGSIVLVADSFLVSNEALRTERQSRLLARLFSGPPNIVFDEEHNDIREQPGIASLVRKYRLHGLVAGLLLLALLFIWKNVVRFVPAYTIAEADRDVVTGKESGEGFVNLLRRTIVPSALLDTCMAEWRKAFANRPRDLAIANEIWSHEQSRPARYRDPIAIYRAISHGLIRKS
ncbi:MAG TPA: DUF4350 domain-containing protein [Chthoniobacter sp.]|jgi:hypothetical protein